MRKFWSTDLTLRLASSFLAIGAFWDVVHAIVHRHRISWFTVALIAILVPIKAWVAWDLRAIEVETEEEAEEASDAPKPEVAK